MKIKKRISERLNLFLDWVNGLLSCPREKKRLLELVQELLEKIRELEDEKEELKPVPTPVTGQEVSYSSMKYYLQKYCPNARIFLSDRKYKTVYYNSMKEWLEWDETDFYKYTTEWYDCDDFSYRLHGMLSSPGWSDLASGIAWSKTHAFNIFMSASKELYLIEPQTDKIIPIEEAVGAYSDIQLVVM